MKQQRTNFAKTFHACNKIVNLIEWWILETGILANNFT